MCTLVQFFAKPNSHGVAILTTTGELITYKISSGLLRKF